MSERKHTLQGSVDSTLRILQRSLDHTIRGKSYSLVHSVICGVSDPLQELVRPSVGELAHDGSARGSGSGVTNDGHVGQ